MRKFTASQRERTQTIFCTRASLWVQWR